MIALVSTVFLASLAGSGHCAGMCGAFVAFAVGLDRSDNAASRRFAHAAYHLGRLVTYTIMGISAGAIGQAFDLAGRAVGLQRAAVVLAGASMVCFGTIAILKMNGVRLPRLPVPSVMQSGSARLLQMAMNHPPAIRAGLTGLLTTLLPCGWLYAFVLTASGTGRPLLGALVMAVFWAGTLPVLAAIGAGARAILGVTGLLGGRIPLLTSLLVIMVGLFSVFDRGRLDAALIAGIAQSNAASPDLLVNPSEPACCHDRARDQ